jgi:hypothetical protein
MLGDVVPLLRRDGDLVLSDHEAALLCSMSAATIDRQLAPERAKLMSRGRSHTKPGTLLKSQIPVRTWAEWWASPAKPDNRHAASWLIQNSSNSIGDM